MKIIARLLRFCLFLFKLFRSLPNGWNRKAKGGRLPLPPFLTQPLSYLLETIPHSDFGSERVRKGYATRSNERDWCLERTSTEIPAKVVTKVGAIRQIEELDKSSDIVTFAKLEVLRDARVKLEEPLAPKIVKRGKLTCPGSQTVSELPAVGCTGRS